MDFINIGRILIDCSLSQQIYILYLLQMGSMCLESSTKKKQSEMVYSDFKFTAQNNPQNTKKLQELQNKERQIAKLQKEKEKLETINKQEAKKHAAQLKELQSSYKMKEAQIKQSSIELAKTLEVKLQTTQQEKQIIQRNKKIQEQEAMKKLRELNQKYEKKIQAIEEQYQLKRQRSAILKQQTEETIHQLVEKHKIELERLIQDNKKQLESNKKKIEAETKEKLSNLERQLQDTKKANLQVNKQSYQSNQHHYNTLFQNEIFEDKGYFNHKSFLINSIESRMKNTISKTRLLFKLDINNKANFHTYIDNKPNIAIIVKLSNEYFVAGFSQVSFVPKSTERGEAMIISLTNQKVFYLFDADKKPISYDQYYLIWGNSQLRIRSQQKKIFSNFGVNNSSFNNKGSTVDVLLGSGREREVDIDYYEIYEIFFQG